MRPDAPAPIDKPAGLVLLAGIVMKSTGQIIAVASLSSLASVVVSASAAPRGF